MYLGDLANEQDARDCVELAVRHFGQIDVLVNNASIFIANATTDLYRSKISIAHCETILEPLFLMTKFALPYLQGTHGNILFTGSEAGF